MVKRLAVNMFHGAWRSILIVLFSFYAHQIMATQFETGNENMLIKVNNISLNYAKTGTGTPLILLHGNGEDHHIFDALTQKLQTHFTIYSLDSRNHGQSAKTDEYAYEIMVDDLYAFIQTLQLGKVDVVGFSDGAIISLLLAMKHPEVLNKMALLGVNLKPSDFTEESYQFIQDTYAETNDPLFKMMLEQPNIDLNDTRHVKVPTLVIAAENDIYKPETFTELANTLPNARLEIMLGHDHGSYVINNDILFLQLLSFFNN